MDSVQALEHALLLARAELQRMGEEASFCDEPAYLALPVMAGTHLPKKYVIRLEKAVERVHSAFYEDAKKRATRAR